MVRNFRCGTGSFPPDFSIKPSSPNLWFLDFCFVGVGAVFMAMWKGIRVGQARKKFGVEYPDMYSKDSKVGHFSVRIDTGTYLVVAGSC